MKICGAPLGDWVNDDYADGLLHVWWVEFGSLGSWSYSEEWVWTSGAKLCSIVPGKWNVSRVAFRNSILGIQCCRLSILMVYQCLIGTTTEFDRGGPRSSCCVTLFTLKNMKIHFITSYVPNSKFKLHRTRKFCHMYELQYTHCFFRATTAWIYVFYSQGTIKLTLEFE